MNKIKILNIVFCLLYPISVVAQIDSSETMRQTIVNVFSKERDLAVFYRKSSIPKSLKKKLKSTFNGFRIVNPNKEYRKTDVVRNPFLPNNQMVFLIQNKEHYALIFMNGGRGLSTYFVYSKIVSNKIEIMKVYTINKTETVEDFLLNIALGKFYSVNSQSLKKL